MGYIQNMTGIEREKVEVDPKVANLVFGGASDSYYKKRGFRVRELTKWSKDLAMGRVPDGYKTMDEFEEYVLERMGEEVEEK